MDVSIIEFGHVIIADEIPSHKDLYCLHRYLVWSVWLKGLNKKPLYSFPLKTLIEPTHDKTYTKTYVTSKYSDQAVHPPSMARILI